MFLNQDVILRFDMLVVPLQPFLIRDAQPREPSILLNLILVMSQMLSTPFLVRFLLLLLSDYAIISELVLTHLEFILVSVLVPLAWG